MVKTLCCLCLALCAGTQAGGAEPAQPLTRLKALKQIPGVNDVHEFAPPFSKGATHQIQIWVGSSTTEILGSLGTTDFGGQINSVLLWVDEPLTTAVQKQALAAVARGVLARCQIGVSGAQLRWVSAIAARPWMQLTFQEKLLGQLHIGWGEGEALKVGSRYGSGLSLLWPGNLSRCDL
ncbi:hypothetical protein QR90_16350 [Deinococcus radiopugnans]|uniref:Uncharacterized protein n=1 Tax=Deinococcus radiopugnans TaxID=57497 RepID=A0A0A7KJK4_9DEIO|nr:hypothetical protein QR90_16350 [Deinococcus radiopugnans]